MSCCTNQQDFCVAAGATLQPVIRWATDVLTTVPISGITQAAPPVVTTATPHGMPNGWPCAVASAGGMIQVNTTRYPPTKSDWQRSANASATQVQLIDLDSTNFAAYTQGGALVFSTPVDLSTVTSVTMKIYDQPDHSGTPLLTLTSPAGIVLDNTAKTITPQLQTAGLTWTTGYYVVDATNSSGVVTELLRGMITIQA